MIAGLRGSIAGSSAGKPGGVLETLDALLVVVEPLSDAFHAFGNGGHLLVEILDQNAEPTLLGANILFDDSAERT